MPEEKQKIIFLEGRIVNLCLFTKDDIPTLTRWINDPELRDFLRSVLPKTEKQQEDWFNKLGSNEENIVLGIETKESILIGSMGVYQINWRDRVCTTVWWIGEKEYWGKGYGTDAKMFLLDYIFNTLNLRKVCSSVITFNERSLQYNLRCGYVREGLRRQHVFKKGKYWDMIDLGLFKEEWLPIWERYRETGNVR